MEKVFLKYFDNLISEMTNITRYKKPALPCNIFISTKVPQHGPRIKFQNNHSPRIQHLNLSVMTISDNPEIIGSIGELSTNDIKYLKSFVIRNKDILLAFWNEKIGTDKVIDLLIY